MLIQNGTQLRIKIIGLRTEVGEMWAVGSIKADFLGCVCCSACFRSVTHLPAAVSSTRQRKEKAIDVRLVTSSSAATPLPLTPTRHQVECDLRLVRREGRGARICFHKGLRRRLRAVSSHWGSEERAVFASAPRRQAFRKFSAGHEKRLDKVMFSFMTSLGSGSFRTDFTQVNRLVMI